MTTRTFKEHRAKLEETIKTLVVEIEKEGFYSGEGALSYALESEEIKKKIKDFLNEQNKKKK